MFFFQEKKKQNKVSGQLMDVIWLFLYETEVIYSLKK